MSASSPISSLSLSLISEGRPKMEHKIRFLTLFICLLSSAVLSTGNEGFEELKDEGGNVKMVFVFGDSYADTGNLPISVSRSWKTPYGITFPGKPSGRFSDGRVLTDYLGDISNKLKPCCNGDCGSVDENGKKKYAVCENPNRSIFWDSIHPSNSGWKAIFSALTKSFDSLLL